MKCPIHKIEMEVSHIEKGIECERVDYSCRKCREEWEGNSLCRERKGERMTDNNCLGCGHHWEAKRRSKKCPNCGARFNNKYVENLYIPDMKGGAGE
jgi:uncharacterized CHY-type Zn-finger protein